MKHISTYTMQSTNYPAWLWNYCFAYTVMIRSVIDSSKVRTNHWVPFEIVKGCTSSLSELILFA